MNEAETAQQQGPHSVADDLGKLILRVSLGVLMLFHGYAKLTGGVAGIEEMLAGEGLPEWIAWGVYIGEVLAPLLLILGLWTRIAAVIFAFNMGVAVALAHANEFLQLGEHGAWALELQALYFFGSVAVVLLGPGRIAAGRNRGWLA
jgi:putative oxidoreductase